MKQSLVTLFAALAVTTAATAPAKADISGAGATFPYPVYAKWADTYKKETNTGLNYQSIGSGGGIKQIIANTVTFGASDKPLSGAELEKNGLVQFPTVMGGIVPVVNLDGITPGQIVLDGQTHRENLSRRNHRLERRGNSEAQSAAEAAFRRHRRRLPLGRIGHDVRLDELSLEGQPRLQIEDRFQHLRAVPGRHRRQG